MSSAAFKVTPEELLSVSSQLTTGAANINSELATLKGRVDTLVGEGWSGAASAGFHKDYNDWQTAAAKLQEALADIAKVLNVAGQNYSDAENTNRTNFG